MAEIKKILVPLDFSDGSIAAERRAEELARVLNAQLVLLHVVDDTPFMLVDGGGYMPVSALQQYEAVSQQKLENCVRDAERSGVSVRGKLLHGRPDQAILKAAKEMGSDLIVMGTHGRRGLSHFLLGSVAERVVRTSDVPVMTVRAEGQSD